MAMEDITSSREFLENIVNMTADGIYVTDEMGCIIMVNRSMCDMTGFSPQELIGKYGAELLSDDSLPLFEAFFSHAFDDGKNTMEAFYYKKDGSQLPVDIKIANMHGTAELAAGIIVSVRDITERKKADDALKKANDELRRSRDFFENVFNMAGDGLHIVDAFGAIVFANKAMCDMLGYDSSELMGKRAIELMPQASLEISEQAMLHDIYARDFSDYFEVLFQRKDGTILPVEAKVTTVRYGSQDSEALIVSVRDITERKRTAGELKKAYDELQRSRDFFENVFNMAGDGIYVTDEIGNIVFANTSLLNMLGYSAAELIGKPAIEITPDLGGSDEYGRMVQEMYAMDYSNYFECLYQCKGGAILPVEVKVTNIQYGSQANSSIIVSVRDITERKLFERDIKAANDELERKVDERTRNLEEVNTALRVLLKARDEDRMALEEKMVSNVRELVSPYIEKLKQLRLDVTQKMYIEIIDNNLSDLISPFLKKVKYFNLTPTEIKVANFIKHGKNTKEIAELLSLSTRTVEGHRDSIRRKLSLNKNKANLRTHLISLD
jgi:PAS domain S-box-containing protein